MHLTPTAECQILILIFEKKLWRGGLYKYPIKNISRTAKFLPTFGYVKGIARIFNWLKCLGGIMHLKPTAECQISILIFEKKLWRGGLYKYPIKNISRTAKFLPTFGQVKGIARVFNWLKCLGGIMHLKPTAGCQISILIFKKNLWRGVFINFSINIPWKIYQGRQSSCPLLASLKVLSGSLTDLSA